MTDDAKTEKQLLRESGELRLRALELAVQALEIRAKREDMAEQLDESQIAARTVVQTIAKTETPLPADVEAAWAEWSRGVQKVDARTMALLRAAFEVGVEAGRLQSR